MPGQSGPRSNGNERVLCIPKRPSITGTSPSDCFVSYPGHSLREGSYPSVEVQSVYSTAPADWANFEDVNDHKTSLSIFQKSLTKTPLPIQRAMLALQQYVFTRNYIPGKDVVVPDILSRAYVNDCKSEISTEDIEAHMYFVNKSRLIITDKKLYIYCVKTATDESLKLLAKYILHGWPEKQKVETLVKPFCNSREDISMLNGIPLKEKQNYRPN